jgi:serine/threonine protein kinase
VKGVKVIQSRYFNHISYDHKLNLITKSSEDEHKLINEIQWYLSLPEEIKAFVPSLKGYSFTEGNVYLQLQYLPYPTLAELLVNNLLNSKEWNIVFSKIEHLLNIFSTYSTRASEEDIISMYIDKTYQRLSAFIKHNRTARMIHSSGSFKLNGKKVECPLNFFEKHVNRITKMAYPQHFTIIHGDLCCSNILYNQKDKQIFLIDPRGSFGRKGIYGDQRYDMSKMRHSFSGYDLIVQDRVTMKCSNFSMDFELPFGLENPEIAKRWDNVCKSMLEEIRIIESLLFLSMLPLHQDNPRRQMMMYALGTKLLHEAVL